MQIQNKNIGKNYPVYIIAEAGVNHNNDLSLAFQMVDIAKESGADAIKFQTFKANNIQLQNSVKPRYQKNIQKNYYNLIKSLETSFKDQKKIFNYCNKKKITFLSTPYDLESLHFLKELGISAFKISSSDLTNHIFLNEVLKIKKPIILSTGISTIKNIDETFNLILKNKMKNKLILVQATSDYPAPNKDINLKVLGEYSKRYDVVTGFSDHTEDDTASLGAVAMGAKLVEKHFTLNRKMSGPDQSSSLEPPELKIWIKKIRLLEQSFGTSKKFITISERNNQSMRKILVIKPIKKGTTISYDLLGTMRGNGKGILPLTSNIKKIIGKKSTKNILTISQLSWNMIK
jgi:N,N'-diacetyllegionaminate synthase